MMMKAAHAQARSAATRPHSAPVTISLSAIESRNPPRVVVICHRRARYPSRKSVIEATAISTAAMPNAWSTESRARISPRIPGTRKIRRYARRSGTEICDLRVRARAW
jgi:hypothetical protein